MTQQNAAMVEESTAASRSLAADANDLKALVGQFRAGGSVEAAASPARAQQARLKRAFGR